MHPPLNRKMNNAPSCQAIIKNSLSVPTGHFIDNEWLASTVEIQ